MSRSPLTWFITGTSSGFGLAMTKMLLERGDRVVATLRKVKVLDELATQYPDQLRAVALDLTHVADIKRSVDEAFSAMGRIDVVVNNAGYGLFGAAEEVTEKRADADGGCTGAERGEAGADQFCCCWIHCLSFE